MVPELPNDAEFDIDRHQTNFPPPPAPDSDANGDSITAQIGERAKNINVGKHINQTVVEGNIGTFIQNLWSGSQESIQHLRARKILLENVNKFWVDGVLKGSLHNEVLLSLGLEEKPSAVANPWKMVLQAPAQTDRILPPATKIIEVFEQQQQSLLILGAPGAGKTTTLLELARDLIAQAQQDATQPIPVVLNLSSWAVQRQPLKAWIATELNSKYYIAPKVAQTWVQQDALLLLLDGLDEVQQEYRGACVAAINAFRKNHVVSLAVCSRVADYQALEQPLQLQGAVLIQPLCQDQIDGYFVRLGAEYTTVRTLLRHDHVFQELSESPLLLSIMMLAYRGIALETLAPQVSEPAHRQHLFDTYITRMFGRRTSHQDYLPKQALYWLTWLATNMVQRQQTIFLIERLQPDWLQARTQTWLYHLIAGLSFGLSFGLLAGLLAGLLDGLSGGLSFGLYVGLFFGLIGWLIFWLSGGLSRRIELTERLVFDWRINKEKLSGGLIGWLILGLYIGLFFGLIGWLIFWLIFGLSRVLKNEEATQSIQSNQGIWQSARNMLIVGLSLGLIVGLIFGLRGGLSGGLSLGLIFGLIAGLISYGGTACIKHIALRGILTFYNHAPLNYARFLDYCAGRIFLRKVGGGYIFIHRLLMEHFAAMTDEDIKRLAGSD